MATSHKFLVATYVSVVTLISTTMGGFVACGAQVYRVPIHGDEPESATPNGLGQSGSNLHGVHSDNGWAKSLPIHFKTSSQIPDAVVKNLQEAMRTWELAVGKQLFVYDGQEERVGDDFKSLYDPLNDSVNGHYFDFNWSQTTGKSRQVLATTIWENARTDVSSIAKADIRYNMEFYVFGDSLTEYGAGQRTIVDMQSLALHELGHLLGLKHVDEKDDKFSVMNPSLFIGEGMITRKLSSKDIDRIRQIYKGGNIELANQLERAEDDEENRIQ